MVRCSCRQKVRRRRSRRRLAEPLSTNGMKSAIHETSCGIQILDPHALSDERSVLVICTQSPHYGGCAVLSNKDTFYPDIEVQSIYLDDTRRELPDKVMEGDPGWVLQGVLSRASFRRLPLISQKHLQFCPYILPISTPKKRRIAKKLILTIRAIMIGQRIDLVAGDFNGTAWRCSNRNNSSTIEEAFADCALPAPRGPRRLWMT